MLTRRVSHEISSFHKTIKNVVLCVMTLCSLITGHQQSGGTCCLQLQVTLHKCNWRWCRQCFPLKCQLTTYQIKVS